ncbi:MAG: aromatic amino acid lyase [Rhodobacterales bacterium]|nr:aromatic amino acid lyase [Rhodobacterales bacterium]
MSAAVRLNGRSLTLADVAAVSRLGADVSLDTDARGLMAQSHDWVAMAASGELLDANGEQLPVYGVNTGYGSLARLRIDQDQIQALSWNLIRSHAAGVGPDVPVDAVRGMMLLRANALARGASGCRPELVERLAEMLNAGVTPIVPQRGSCGSSGDLAPLAHLGLVVFGNADEDIGTALYKGERMSGPKAMAAAGLEQLMPGPKEGLAMTNGAQLTCSISALACFDAGHLVHDAQIAAALSWEALLGVTRALHPGVHALRPFRGAIDCAADIRLLLNGSQLTDSLPDKVQDAYSVRCTPQVLGAVRDGIRYATAQVSVELNAVTDNPILLMDSDDANKAYSAGMFHGEPVGMAADHLKLSLCELGALSERRLYRLTTGKLSSKLPPLLRHGPGLGLVIPQTTAAALVAENRQLAWPCSADSLPTCEDQEDHVAMSTTAARRAARVLTNARRVVAIETLAAAHGIWLRLAQDPSLKPGVGTSAALAALEEILGGRKGTGAPSDHMKLVEKALIDGTLRKAVTAAVGNQSEVYDV